MHGAVLPTAMGTSFGASAVHTYIQYTMSSAGERPSPKTRLSSQPQASTQVRVCRSPGRPAQAPPGLGGHHTPLSVPAGLGAWQKQHLLASPSAVYCILLPRPRRLHVRTYCSTW
ncbi:hypothetical protein ACJQWK_10807 [Exserohilum turcicum]